MILSPLQLEAYWLTELTFRANPDHQRGKEVQFRESELEVTPTIQALAGETRRWQVTLRIKLQPCAEANSPCFFSLTLVGLIWAASILPEDRLEGLVRTNGPSMLFGAAREMVRDLTARGPFLPLVLPSVSFLAEGGTSAAAPAASEAPAGKES